MIIWLGTTPKKMAVESSECSSSFEAAHVFGRKISWFSNPSKNKKQATDSFPLPKRATKKKMTEKKPIIVDGCGPHL
jgi:hypothetical protein